MVYAYEMRTLFKEIEAMTATKLETEQRLIETYLKLELDEQIEESAQGKIKIHKLRNPKNYKTI